MQKQDISRARTTQDLERRYGKSFAEAYGLAMDAQDAAKKAEAAAAAAAAAVAGLDSDAIFNLLTNNGEIQGLYKQDGKLYINAEYVQILNMVVETIMSKDSFGGAMEILGGIFRLYQDEGTLVEVSTEYEGYPVMRMTMLTDGKETTLLEMGPEGFQVIDMTGDVPTVKFAMQLDEDGDPAVTCKNTSGSIVTKKIVWKANSDGTSTLIGQ